MNYFIAEVLVWNKTSGKKAFWLRLLEALGLMNFERCKAEPCLYFQGSVLGLVLIISRVDDFLICGNKGGVLNVKKELKTHFEIDYGGEIKENVGCKFERNESSIKVTQPALMQSYEDEFPLTKGEAPLTPAPAREGLQNAQPRIIPTKRNNRDTDLVLENYCT